MAEVTVAAAGALLLGVACAVAAVRQNRDGDPPVVLIFWTVGSLALAALLGALVVLGLLIGEQR